MKTIDENILEIRALLDDGEILVQLSEESSELSQAALKKRRTIVPGNPTPMTPEEAHENILEEVADISLCLRVLGYDSPHDLLRVQQIMAEKAERWPNRIKEARQHG